MRCAKRQWLVIGVAVAMGCAAPDLTPRPSRPAVMLSWDIAGGAKVPLPVSVDGPVAVENDLAIVRAAGFSLKPANQRVTLSWNFSAGLKSGFEPAAISVSDVTRDPEQELLADDAPAVKQGVWSRSTPSVDASEATVPWLYAGETTMKVFRFTFTPKTGAAFSLYQPMWFGPKTKKEMLRITREALDAH